MKYYSEKLDKIFDAEEDLKAAEKELEEAEAKKAEAKALVKKDAEVVNTAFVARNTARHNYNEKVLEARKVYNEKVKAAQEEFNKAIAEVTEAKKAAEKDFSDKLSEFSKTHPEGYRLTLKDGDETATYYSESKYNTDVFDDFDRLVNAFVNFRLW